MAGNAHGLSQGERRLGLDSQVLALYSRPFGYPADIEYRLDGRSLPVRLLGHFEAFVRYRSGYDVFHFNGGATPLHFRSYGLILLDLPFYDRDARKFFTFQGDDARPSRATDRRADVDNARKRRAIEKAARHADHLFALNPDLLAYLPEGMSSFLPYTIPTYYTSVGYKHDFFVDDRVRVVHAPSNRAAKGSHHVFAAIEKLQEELADRFVFETIEGVSNSEAQQRIARADLLIDQLLIGWYGGVAVEAMRMGVPVAVYVDHSKLERVPQRMVADFPFIHVTADTLRDRLRAILRDRDQLKEAGRRARDYVERWHDPEMVAGVVANAYATGRPGPLEPRRNRICIDHPAGNS